MVYHIYRYIGYEHTMAVSSSKLKTNFITADAIQIEGRSKGNLKVKSRPEITTNNIYGEE